MTDQENELMKLYGIKAENKIVYLYQRYKYEKLSDAIEYAKIEKGNLDPGKTSNS